jgi:hypothetical protein
LRAKTDSFDVLEEFEDDEHEEQESTCSEQRLERDELRKVMGSEFSLALAKLVL